MIKAYRRTSFRYDFIRENHEKEINFSFKFVSQEGKDKKKPHFKGLNLHFEFFIMNDKKICFIICYNDDKYISECLHYINRLTVPDGYLLDVLTVKNADSMTSGYNAAMNETDAKYKIYMHQDVFIVNINLLEDILKIFEDKNVGMLGGGRNTEHA